MRVHLSSCLLRAPLLVTLLLTSGLAPAVRANVIFFRGSDPGHGPGTGRPLNSDQAAADFQMLASPNRDMLLIDEFGSYPINSGGPFEFVGRESDMQVKLSLEQNDPGPPPNGYQFGVSNQAGDSQIGFDTSLTGSRYLRIVPNRDGLDARIVFDFVMRPIQGFGFYLTGLGTVGDVPLLLDIDGEEYDVPGSAQGGVQYVGFLNTDANAAIKRVVLTYTGISRMQRDVFAIDDISVAFRPNRQINNTPEPSSLLLLAAGFVIAVSGRAVSRRWAANRSSR